MKSNKAKEFRKYGIDSFDCDQYLSELCKRKVNSKEEMNNIGQSLNDLIDLRASNWSKELGYNNELWIELKKYLSKFDKNKFKINETNI